MATRPNHPPGPAMTLGNIHSHREHNVTGPILTLAILLIACVDFCGVSSVLAQGQKPNYLWEGWHKVPDPSHIQYKVFHDSVVALSNLSEGCGGPSSSFSFTGKIAKVNFDNQGLMITNLVLETNDGDRSLINVDPIDPGMNRADLGWILQGLRTLLRPDWYMKGSAFACGASGRVLMLDKIESASSTGRRNLSCSSSHQRSDHSEFYH
jgi:hypothetical protein